MCNNIVVITQRYTWRKVVNKKVLVKFASARYRFNAFLCESVDEGLISHFSVITKKYGNLIDRIKKNVLY